MEGGILPKSSFKGYSLCYCICTPNKFKLDQPGSLVVGCMSPLKVLKGW